MREHNRLIPDKKTKDWKKFIREFHNKSDRTTAIISAAYLESQLRQLLSSFFIDQPDVVEHILDPGEALGSLKNLIIGAYVLGLISKDEYEDLILISKIRNALVNQNNGQTFDDTDIRKLCVQFSIPLEVLHPNDNPTPRRLFVFTSAVLVRHLAQRTMQAETEKRTVPPPYKLSKS